MNRDDGQAGTRTTTVRTAPVATREMPMRTAFLTVLTASALLAMSGCVQFHSDMTIDATGGGTATMSMSVATEVLAAVTEIKNTGGATLGVEVPDVNGITRASLEKRAAGQGVTVKAFEKGVSGGRQTLSCTLDFTGLKGLSRFMNEVAPGISGAGLGITPAADGNLALRTVQYDFPSAQPAKKAAAPAPTPEQAQRHTELAMVVMSALGETDLVMKFTVPGDIVRSNATTVEGRTSIWSIDASNMMSQQADVAPEIVFAGKGLSITPKAE
jgi:hypothetical protein